MRKFILGAGVALAAAAGPVAAQGLPTQSPAPVVPVAADGPPAPPAVLPSGPGAPVVPLGGNSYPIDGGYTGLVGDGGPPYRFYTEGSFLLWFLDSTTVASPLVTTGPSLGVLRQPGTAVLSSAQSADYGAAPGFRVAAGGWLGSGLRLGFEMSGFYIGRQQDTHSFGGNSAAIISRPFFDTVSRRENVRVVAAPGAFSGGVVVDHSAQLWGVDGTPFWRVINGNSVVVDVLTGFKFLQYQEALNVFDASAILAGGASAFNGFGVAAPAQIAVHDRFGATNSFYGGTLGARMSSGRGGLFWDLTGKVSLGGVNQVVNVDGTTSLVRGGPFVTTATAPGGFLASGNYLGRRSETRFAVLPEGDFKIGYQFTSWMNAFVGYSVLYVSSVARPGDQVNRNLAVTQLPTSPTFNSAGARPAAIAEIIDDGLWVHGFNFGVTLTY
ncbi:MAG TPA: BBP7 family outer membrane beta-barrel protein [Fimbriiglobus sp.]|nr:BBP7 family outer membrane beta-barrel protein [Fimbriiglobus sp.]